MNELFVLVRSHNGVCRCTLLLLVLCVVGFLHASCVGTSKLFKLGLFDPFSYFDLN